MIWVVQRKNVKRYLWSMNMPYHAKEAVKGLDMCRLESRGCSLDVFLMHWAFAERLMMKGSSLTICPGLSSLRKDRDMSHHMLFSGYTVGQILLFSCIYPCPLTLKHPYFHMLSTATIHAILYSVVWKILVESFFTFCFGVGRSSRVTPGCLQWHVASVYHPRQFSSFLSAQKPHAKMQKNEITP